VVHELQGVVDTEFFVRFNCVFVVVRSGDIQLRMEGSLLLRVDLPSESVVISVSLDGVEGASSRSGQEGVDVLLVEFPSNFQFQKVVDTELIVSVLQEAVRAREGAYAGLVGGHGHGFDQVGLTGGHHGGEPSNENGFK